jgi:hypothetical protein
LEVNGESSKYMIMSRELNEEQNHILKTGNTDIPRYGVLPNCFLRYFEQICCAVAQCPGRLGLCEISRFLREVDGNSTVLGYYAACSGDSLPKFRSCDVVKE